MMLSSCSPDDVLPSHSLHDCDRQDHVNAIDYNVPLAKGREVTSTKRYDGGYGKEDTWVTYTKQFADIVNG
jgi:hypothetical protein